MFNLILALSAARKRMPRPRDTRRQGQRRDNDGMWREGAKVERERGEDGREARERDIVRWRERAYETCREMARETERARAR